MARPPKEPNPNPSTFSQAVGAEIRRRRLEKGLTADACAEAAGIPASSWYHAEAGKFSFDRLPAIAAAVGCPAHRLLPKKWPG